MRLCYFFLFLITLQARTVRYYTALNYAWNIPFSINHSDALTGWYAFGDKIRLYRNGSATVETGEDLESIQTHVNALQNAIPNRKLTVHLIWSKGFDGIYNFSSESIQSIPVIVNHIKATGADGMLIDFEPTNGSALYVAEMYAAFLGVLGPAMRKESLELAIDISAWGSIDATKDWFSLYTKNEYIDFFTSMDPTYNGKDVTKDKAFSEQLKQKAGANRTYLGIGTMPVSWEGKGCEWNYHWTQSKFEDFVSYLGDNGFEHIDIWPCDIDFPYVNGTEPWIFDALVKFLSG